MKKKFCNNLSILAILFLICFLISYVIFWKWSISLKPSEAFIYIAGLLSFFIFWYGIFICLPIIENFWQIKKSSINIASPNFLYLILIAWIFFINSLLIALAIIKSPDLPFSDALNNFHILGVNRVHYFDNAFFPLFPILLKIFNPIVRNLFLTSLIINSVLAFFSGVYFYKLLLGFFYTKDALRGIKYLFIFPSAFFFFLPTTESLFLFLTISFTYNLLKQKYIEVFICGFLAALTRFQGILLVIPLLAELIRVIRNDCIEKSFVLDRSITFKDVITKQSLVKCASILGPILGISMYLLINYWVYGNPFYYKNLQNKNIILVSWIILFLIIYGVRRIRISFTLYAFSYFVSFFLAINFLNEPIYAFNIFPLTMCLNHLTKNKNMDIFLTAICFTGFFIYLYIFTFHVA